MKILLAIIVIATIPFLSNSAKIDTQRSTCYAVEMGVGYQPTGDEPNLPLRGRPNSSGDYIVDYPHGLIFRARNKYWRVDCRYE